MFANGNAGLVGGLGLIAGIIGLMLTIAGFWLALKQLVRTRRAAEAASSAVNSVKIRVATFDFGNECIIATKSLEHAITCLRHCKWTDAIAQLWDAQRRLNRLSQMDRADNSLKQNAEASVQALSEIITSLEKMTNGEINQFDTSQALATIRLSVGYLDQSITRVQKEIYDV